MIDCGFVVLHLEVVDSIVQYKSEEILYCLGRLYVWLTIYQVRVDCLFIAQAWMIAINTALQHDMIR